MSIQSIAASEPWANASSSASQSAQRVGSPVPPNVGIMALAPAPIPVVQPVPNVPLAVAHGQNNLHPNVTGTRPGIAVVDSQKHGLKTSAEEELGTKVVKVVDLRSVEAMRKNPSAEIVKGSLISIKS